MSQNANSGNTQFPSTPNAIATGIVQGSGATPASAGQVLGAAPAGLALPSAQPNNGLALDGLDLNLFKLPNTHGAAISVKKKLTRIKIGKPGKDRFFRVRAGEEWQIQTAVLELREDGEVYILGPQVWEVVPELTKYVTLRLAVDKQGNPAIIPVPLPDQSGKWNPWHESLAKVVDTAETSWLRCAANMAAGSYDMFIGEGITAEPAWPEETFAQLLKIAFTNRIITDEDHPVIQQLQGML